LKLIEITGNEGHCWLCCSWGQYTEPYIMLKLL